MPKKLEDCVKDLEAQGHSSDSAWAICQHSVMGKSFKEEWKEKFGIDGAGPVPESLLAGQDLEGEEETTKAQIDEIVQQIDDIQKALLEEKHPEKRKTLITHLQKLQKQMKNERQDSEVTKSEETQPIKKKTAEKLSAGDRIWLPHEERVVTLSKVSKVKHPNGLWYRLEYSGGAMEVVPDASYEVRKSMKKPATFKEVWGGLNKHHDAPVQEALDNVKEEVHEMDEQLDAIEEEAKPKTKSFKETWNGLSKAHGDVFGVGDRVCFTTQNGKMEGVVKQILSSDPKKNSQKLFIQTDSGAGYELWSDESRLKKL